MNKEKALNLSEKQIGRAISKLRWERKENCFVSQMTITRKPFGEFYCNFIEKTDGCVSVEITGNYGLKKPHTIYADFSKASSGVVSFFEEIEEKRRNLPKGIYDKAKNAYCYVIASAINNTEDK